MPIIPAFLLRLRTLRRDRHGNVLILFAISIVPLMLATGMGIDYSQAMRLRTRLNAAADAAALSSTTTPMLNQTMATACTTALNMFKLQSSQLPGLILDTDNPAKFSIVMAETYGTGAPKTGTCGALSGAQQSSTATPLSRTATISYQGDSINTFATLLGKRTLTITGTVSTRVANSPYIDIHIALDTSQSMGLPSTIQGQKDLWKLSGQINGTNCQFGCHEKSIHNGKTDPQSGEQIARANNIPLRVNVESAAVTDMISTASASQGSKSYYRFGLYQFGTSLRDLQPLTSTLSTASSSVANLTLGPNDGAIGYGDTNLTDVFNAMQSRITVHGDGTSATNPRAFLFVVTDGVQDLCSNSHCMALLDPTMCNWYKNNNITVGIVYTTYLPVMENPLDPNNPNYRFEYNWLIAPLPPSNIAPRLQACASPGWFFEASDGPGIHAAMQRLFTLVTQTTAITR